MFEPLSNTELAVLARAVPRGSHIRAYLSTDVDRIMVAKPLTECNIVFFSNVSSGHANVQHVVVDGVDAVSRAHVWRIVFCLPHNGADRMVCSHATALQHTEQPVGDVHALFRSNLSADVRSAHGSHHSQTRR